MQDQIKTDHDRVALIRRQLVELIQALLNEERSGSIDLSALGLDEDERGRLLEELGEGEITAEAFDVGPMLVRETGIPGVWWLTHHNPEGEVLGEFLEVAYCPDVLIAAVDDVRDGLSALRARLFESEYLRGPK